ncbi:hypothetical protein CTA2_1723 [Colletotrichum tanaceti]|uniref:Uncharacterized protein n=1 Tax=Colletotrichum tanaceti TaxID=1306861 RepID=A0A4U6XDK8_9PEZI|nr:hypothetical protein CTA2_1723 [Colletotrichum tanaceti]TKW51937.1 hypothetical protein CTA1_10090 [Colletotrichum tanaceti]
MIKVENSDKSLDDCNPWWILPYFRRVDWVIHATAPLMLEAIQDLIISAFKGENHPLVPRNPQRRGNIVYVEKTWLNSAYFKKKKTASKLDWATKDVLGFLSIVLTNTKNAQELSAPIWNPRLRNTRMVSGPKSLLWLLPRNNWVSVFSLVKDKLPEEGKQLWDMLEHLACYQNTRTGKLKLDKRFCEGTVDDPQPNGMLEKQAWSEEGGYPFLLVKDWVDSFVNNAAGGPDLLTKFDADHFDGQIGRFDELGKTFEHVLNSDRPVTLWEFRSQGRLHETQLPRRLKEIRNAVVELHEKYPNEPTPTSEEDKEEDEAVPEEEVLEVERCRKWWHLGNLCGKGGVH